MVDAALRAVPSAPSVRVEIITPARAAEYLKANTNNRPLSKPRIKKLVKAITSGHWQLTHQGIAFDSSGVLLDGQTRLHAILQADMPVQMMVSRGLKTSAFTCIDAGTPRMASDVLAMEGYRHPRVVAAALVLQWVYLMADGDMSCRTPLNAGNAPDKDDYIQMALEYPRLVEIAGESTRSKRLLVPSWSAWLRYQFELKDPDLSQDFFDALQTGAGLVDGNPVLALRNRLFTMFREESFNKRSRAGSIVLKGAISIIAWNALRNGREIFGNLRWRTMGPKKQVFPTIE